MRAKHTSMIKIRIGLKIWKVIIITRNNSHKRTFLSISYAFEIDDHDQNPNRTLMQKLKVTHNSHRTIASLSLPCAGVSDLKP